MRPITVFASLTVALLVASCTQSSRSTTFDAECGRALGLALQESRLDTDTTSLSLRVGTRWPVGSDTAYDLLAWARRAYPRYERVSLSVYWPRPAGGRTINSCDWRRGDAAGGVKVHRPRESGGGGGRRFVWESGTATLAPDHVNDPGSLLFISWIDADPSGGGAYALSPQLLVTGATDSWMDDVATGKVKAPAFPAPQLLN